MTQDITFVILARTFTFEMPLRLPLLDAEGIEALSYNANDNTPILTGVVERGRMRQPRKSEHALAPVAEYRFNAGYTMELHPAVSEHRNRTGQKDLGDYGVIVTPQLIALHYRFADMPVRVRCEQTPHSMDLEDEGLPPDALVQVLTLRNQRTASLSSHSKFDLLLSLMDEMDLLTRLLLAPGEARKPVVRFIS